MISIVPMPLSVTRREGIVIFNRGSLAYFDKAFVSSREYFKDTLAGVLIGGIATTSSLDKATFKFVLDESMEREEYSIDVTCTDVLVKASTDIGCLYALVSLNQQLGTFTREPSERLELEVLSIKDKPRYAWRGVLLDVSRHFFTVAEVKKMMDNMFLHKLNVLHLHLTDDQGWRIEIKKYPLLTEIGSRRKWTQIHGWPNVDPEKDIEKVEHSGYYSQEDIKDLVAYGEARGIMIVPEIDMPAHFRAAMAGYPFLQCDETKKREVPWYFGAKFATLEGDANDVNIIACAGKETTYEFIEGVLSEVASLFPAPYFHIGGDEAPKSEWLKCPHCKAKMESEHLKSAEELQDYFNNRVVEMLKKYGKKLIVWNEALEGGKLDISTIGQYWTPTRDKNAEEYANKKGGKLILSKHSAFYFDMCYGQVPVQATYNFDPKNVSIDDEGEKNVLGVEGTLWTEWIADMAKLEFNSNPRFAALSESAWTSPKNKDYDSFKLRLEELKKIYDKLGIRYASNKVAMVKNPIRRLREMAIWNKDNKHHEMTEDVRFRGKGCK